MQHEPEGLYPAFLKVHLIDLDETGLSVVEVGGKQNLPIFIKVLEAFSIPYVTVFDEDAPEDKVNRSIEAIARDKTRLHIHKPDLERAIGFTPKERGKVVEALSFVQELNSDQKASLCAPLQRLLSEIRPDMVKQLSATHEGN